MPRRRRENDSVVGSWLRRRTRWPRKGWERVEKNEPIKTSRRYLRRRSVSEKHDNREHKYSPESRHEIRRRITRINDDRNRGDELPSDFVLVALFEDDAFDLVQLVGGIRAVITRR